MVSPEHIQRQVLGLCQKINKLRYSVARLLEEVPQPEGEDWDGMANGELPPSLAYNLHVTLAYVEGEVCKEATESLIAAALTNPTRLRESWERDLVSFKTRFARELEAVCAAEK